VEGIENFFYKHCVCNNTRRKEFFNRTHTSTCTTKFSVHKFPRTDDATASTTDETASISSYNSSDISSLGSTSSLGCSLGVILPATKPPPLQPVDENNIDDDLDGLEFVGDFLADISTDDAVWVSVTPDSPSFTEQVGVTSYIANGKPPSDWNSDPDS